MKRLLYFLRDFRIDIYTTICTLIGIILAWKYAPTEKTKMLISVIAVVVALLIIIYSRSKSKDFVFSAFTRAKDKEDWIGYGLFQLNRVQSSYEITDADPGYIHSKILAWSDYKISFEFKIASWGTDGGLGVIVRANNLANYIMLQIKQNGIGPHIKANGGWKVWQPAEVNLVFSKTLNLDNWYMCEVFCDKSTITLKIFEEKVKIFDRVWEIPRGTIMFNYQHSSEHPTTHLPLPITLEYGSVGFRNWSSEKTFIKNMLVEKL